MVGPRIDIDACKGCGLCVSFCPRGVLALSAGINARGIRYAVAVEPEKCSDCGICYMMCPDAVVEVTEPASGKSRA